MGIYISVGYAINIPLCMSLVTSNVAGFSKRSVVSAMVFIAYCLGNIVGPQFYNESEAPSYPVSNRHQSVLWAAIMCSGSFN